MSLSYTILDPALDLFLYDLRDSFGQSEAAIAENRRQFWRRIYGDEKTIEAILSAQRSKEDELSDYVQLIDPYPHIQKLAPPLDNGYYYPVKLGDTYGLQIDCSGKLNDPQWEKISQLQQLEDLATEIRSRCGEKWGTVGQSWLFVGQLDRHNPGVDAVAKDCYEGLKLTKTPNWKRDLKGKGRLCGATLYELEKPDTTPDGKNHHFHAIVCLFDFDYPDDKRQDEIQYLYRDLMRLLHFRHKILWIYEQTRLIKHDSKQLGYDIQKLVDRLPDRLSSDRANLNQLQTDLASALQLAYDYDRQQSALQQSRFTLEINADNYRQRLDKMSDRDNNSNLEMLARFSRSARQYMRQTSTDERALLFGRSSLEDFIDTIENIIKVEHTKNERTLNQTIAVASVGIGAASIAIAALPQETQPSPPSNLKDFSFSGAKFAFSIIVGLVFALAAYLVPKLLRKLKRSTASRN